MARAAAAAVLAACGPSLCLASLPADVGPDVFVPGARAPAFRVPLVDGSILDFDQSRPPATPLAVFAFNASDPFSRAMLGSSNSVSNFITTYERNQTRGAFLFVAVDNASIADLGSYVTGLIAAVKRQSTAPAMARQLLSRIHVASATLADKPMATLAPILQQWLTPVTMARLHAGAAAAPLSAHRLDCYYGSCAWPLEHDSTTLVDAGDGCRNLTGAVSKSSYSLLTATNCTFESALSNAVKAGAFGVVFVQRPGADLVAVGANSNVDGVGITATMVSASAGMAMKALLHQQAGKALPLQLDYEVGDFGFFLAIDGSGSLQQVGWQKQPLLSMLTWELQWLDYSARQRARLSQPAFVVPVAATPTALPWTAQVEMPDPALLSSFATMELDMGLECYGNKDKDCSVWDHCVVATVTCGSQSHQWLEEPGGGPTELGRWITPFKRRVGRWLTNSTALMPMLTAAGTSCSFHMQVGGERWLTTLNLRFSDPLPRTAGQSPVVARQQPPPSAIFPLVWPNQGTTFDSPAYNENRTLTFMVPEGLTRVAVEAIITGHGDCEFLPTSHAYTVNGHTFDSNDIAFDRYMRAGTELGCADQVPAGSVPNEHGTWMYGRNGWCDGQDVKPLVWDVSAAVVLGQPNTITYAATSYDVGGKNPTDKGCGGYILLSNSVVFSPTAAAATADQPVEAVSSSYGRDGLVYLML